MENSQSKKPPRDQRGGFYYKGKWPLFKKRRKNFFDFGPETLERRGPKLQKFFCYFLFTKSSLSYLPFLA
jgi:hypothetical protein